MKVGLCRVQKGGLIEGKGGKKKKKKQKLRWKNTSVYWSSK